MRGYSAIRRIFSTRHNICMSARKRVGLHGCKQRLNRSTSTLDGVDFQQASQFKKVWEDKSCVRLN